MSGEGMALDFLAALQGPRESAPSAAAMRGPRLATVDASYGGSGAARVIFDGESVAGLRTYVALQPVSVGDRVVLLPVGHTFVILGGVGGELATELDDLVAADVALDSRLDVLEAREALIRVIPASVAVNAGSASVAADGTITGTGFNTLTVTDYAVGDFDRYRFVWDIDSTNAASDLLLLLRTGSTDLTSSSYANRYNDRSSGGFSGLATTDGFGIVGRTNGDAGGGAGAFEINRPNRAKRKKVIGQSRDANFFRSLSIDVTSAVAYPSLKLYLSSSAVATDARLNIYAYRD